MLALLETVSRDGWSPQEDIRNSGGESEAERLGGDDVGEEKTTGRRQQN